MTTNNIGYLCKLSFTGYSIICIFFYSIAWLGNFDNLTSFSLSLFIGQLILFFLVSFVNKDWAGNLTNPSYLALLGLLIVNLQNIINICYGYGTPSDYAVTYSVNKVFNKGAQLSLLGLSVYLLTIFLYKPHRFKTHKTKQIGTNPKIWLSLLLISFIGFLAFSNLAEIISGADYLNNSDEQNASLGNYFEGCINSFACIYICAIIYRLSNDGKKSLIQFLKSLSLIFWIVIILYLSIRAMSGDRGPVIYILLTILYGYIYYSKKKFKAITVVLGIIAAAVVVTIMGIARKGAMEAAFGERVSSAIELMGDNNSDNKSISPYTQELANSSQCTLIAIEAHESGAIDYQFGRYTFYNLIQTIPMAGGLLKNGLGLDWNNVSSSSFITKRGLGPQPHYGLGTSAVADFYLEFGIIGVIIGFIIAAIIFKRIDYIFLYSIPVSSSVLIFSIIFASHAIYFGRSSLSALLYISISTLILYWVINFIFKTIKK